MIKDQLCKMLSTMRGTDKYPISEAGRAGRPGLFFKSNRDKMTKITDNCSLTERYLK